MARHTSLATFALAFGLTFGHMTETVAKMETKEAQQREEKLAQIARDEREIVCLTNIVWHEARGELRGFRDLSGRVVLAIVKDRTFTPSPSICGLTHVPGFFSAIKSAEESHHENRVWSEIYAHMDEVFRQRLTLPRGWGCARGFRGSDDYLEKLNGRQIAQLGFTMDAKGLRYFAAKMVPIDTRGRITFYSPRGGCSNPTETT